MLFNKIYIKKPEVYIILFIFLGVFSSSCSRKKVKSQNKSLSSFEFPTKVIPFNCKKTFESLTLILKKMDLKRVSFKRNFIKTHWIDNTFSFFDQEKDNILDKSAKFKLFLKGKPPKKNKENCKLTIFKNQKVRYDRLSPWISTPSDRYLEQQLFSKITGEKKESSDYTPDENEDSEPFEGELEESEAEDDSDQKDQETIEDQDEVENIESIENLEKEKEDEESIESIEDLES